MSSANVSIVLPDRVGAAIVHVLLKHDFMVRLRELAGASRQLGYHTYDKRTPCSRKVIMSLLSVRETVGGGQVGT